MSFDVQAGQCSLAGARHVQEDFVVVRVGEAAATHGWLAVIADGVSSGGAGREAAQTTALAVAADYPATPEHWDTTVALDRVIAAQNAWLVDHNRRRQHAPTRDAEGRAQPASLSMTTLTALVLRAQGWTLGHVGDTRAWLLRDGECSLLTQDHAFADAQQRTRLTRAVGLDDRVRVDYLTGALRIGDVFALTSDGVHASLTPRRIGELMALAGKDDASAASDADASGSQAAAMALVQAALRAGSRDNASAVVLHVRRLPPADWRVALQAERWRPLPPRLRVGDRLDGLTVTAALAMRAGQCLYQVRDARGALAVLKAPDPEGADEAAARAALVREAWLLQRLSPTPEAAARREATVVRSRATGVEPSACYRVYEWVPGRTLDRWLESGRRFAVSEIVDGCLALARALGRAHHLGVSHGALSPEVLLLGDDGLWRLLDLARFGEPTAAAESPDAAHARADLYDFGVLMYGWLTGRSPYRGGDPVHAPGPRRDPRPPSRLRPDVPIWLDHVVLKAVALDPAQRFETADELALALERGASRPLAAVPPTPWLGRHPTAGWKLALLVSLMVNLLLLVAWLLAPR